MEKLLQLLFYVFVALANALTCCKATTYMVGDNSGWDISTNLETWQNDKKFNVGDVLVFQYSSSHSVSEVTRESFDSCNTTNVLRTLSGGNTTVTIDKPGETYYICGNRLHCLGGMKLKVAAESNQSFSPVGSPESATDLPNPSSKSNKQIPSSTASGIKAVTGLVLLVSAIVSLLLNA